MCPELWTGVASHLCYGETMPRAARRLQWLNAQRVNVRTSVKHVVPVSVTVVPVVLRNIATAHLLER